MVDKVFINNTGLEFPQKKRGGKKNTTKSGIPVYVLSGWQIAINR